MCDHELFPLTHQEKAVIVAEEKKLGFSLTEWKQKSEYDMCFACGIHNPIGLHLHFFLIPNGCLAVFTPSHEHQSYNDRMHGGLIMTLMDEVMGNYLFMKEGKPAYTGKMESRFRNPVLIGETVIIFCQETKRKGHLVVMEAQVKKPDGTICAEATSHMMLM